MFIRSGSPIILYLVFILTFYLLYCVTVATNLPALTDGHANVFLPFRCCAVDRYSVIPGDFIIYF